MTKSISSPSPQPSPIRERGPDPESDKASGRVLITGCGAVCAAGKTVDEIWRAVADGRSALAPIMQWDSSAKAGFTTGGKPWLPIPPSAAKYNVEAESKDPDSIFNAYKRLLALRKTEQALRDGSQESINDNDPNVFAFLRKNGDAAVLVALNMSRAPRTVAFHLAEKGVRGTSVTTLYSSPNQPEGSLSLDHVVLPPFGALVVSVK